MAVRTEEEWESAAQSARLLRRITASGQVNNFNLPDKNADGDYVADDGVTLLDVRFLDYMGKITKMVIDSTTDTGDKTAAAQFTRKFEGETEQVVDPEVMANTESLGNASETALKQATDACATMNTLAVVSEDIAEPALQAEQASQEMMGKVTEAAAVCGEVVGEVSTVLADIPTLIQEASTLVPQLREAGETQLANALEEAMDTAANITETCSNGLNVALGAEVPDIGSSVETAIGEAETALADASAVVGDMMKAIESGGCNGVAEKLQTLPTPNLPGEAGSIAQTLKEKQPQQTRMLNVATDRYPDGLVVNFNIDKKLPYADIEYNGKLTRMHYADPATMLRRFGTLGISGGILV